MPTTEIQKIIRKCLSSWSNLDLQYSSEYDKVEKEMTEALNEAYTLGHRAAIESLEAIEHIVASDECADIEYKLAMDRFDSPTEKSMAEMLGQIYKIAHSSNPKHTCYDVHQNWRDEIKSLKESDNGSAQEK